MNRYRALLFFLCTSAFGSTVTLPDGRKFSVGDWTPPVTELLSSVNGGSIAVVKRTTTVTEPWRDTVSTYPIVFLYEPSKRQVWLTTPADHYFELENRIYGLVVSNSRVFLKGSVTANEDQSDEEIISDALRQFLQNPIGDYGATSAMIDLLEIFGYRDIDGRTSSPPIRTVNATSLRVGDGYVRISGETVTTNKIELTLDKTLRVTAARKNGDPVLLLSDGRLPRKIDRPLIYPGEITIRSGRADVKLIFGGSVFEYTDRTGNARQMNVTVVVNPATGDVFFGPPPIHYLAILAGKIVGVMMDGKTDLLIYNQYGRMAITGNTIDSFQNLLQDFCNHLRDGTFKEAARISLPDLPNIPKAEPPWFSLYNVHVRDFQLHVLFHGPWHDKYLDLGLDRHLRIISSSL